MKVLLLAVLVVVAWSYTVTISCGPCSQGFSQTCNTLDGGPFDDYQVPAGGSTSCQGVSTIFLEFTCTSQCSSCLLQGSSGGQTQQQCLDSSNGQLIEQGLNFIYGQSQGNPTAQYNWCQCGSSANVGLIVGLVVGGVVLVAIIGGVVFYFRRKNQLEAQSMAAGPSTLYTGRTVEMG